MNGAEGNFDRNFENPENQRPKNLPEFDERANRELKPYGRKIVKGSNYELMRYGLVVLAIGVLIFGYVALNDKFKTDISCPTFTCPTTPACPSCPGLNLSLPDCTNTCNFPSSININLTNGTI